MFIYPVQSGIFCIYVISNISKALNFIDTINIDSDEWLVIYKAYN